MPGDGVVALDLDRYAHVPDRLARVAGDLDDAVRTFGRVDHPVGARAAAAFGGLAEWVRRERARATARWDRLLAIPGFARFQDWDHDHFEWTVAWLTHDDRRTYTIAELEALAAYVSVLAPLFSTIDGDRPVERDDVEAAVAAVAAVLDPAAAALLLNIMGAGRFRALHEAAAAITDPTSEDDVRALEDALEGLSGTLIAASRAVGSARLGDDFLDGFLAEAEAVTVHPPTDDELAAAMSAFATLDVGRELATRLAAITGPEGAVAVLERAGGACIILTLAMPLVALAEYGPVSGEFVGTTISSGLALASFLATGPLASFGFFVASALVSLIMSSGEGEPPGLVLSPDAENPGGSHYPYYVNEAGVPVAPGGR